MLWLSLLLGLVLASSAAGVAYAHANLVRSEPAANAVLEAPPSAVHLWFSEAAEPRFSEVRLFQADGQPVDGVGSARADPADPSHLATSLPPLATGFYTVQWRALSTVDGHVTAGSFAFSVGRDQVPSGGLSGAPTLSGSTASPSLPAVLARWMVYAGLALLTGGFAFGLIARRATGSGMSSPAIHSLLIAGWAFVLAGTLVGTVMQAAVSADSTLLEALGEPLWSLLMNTRYGALFWLRLSLLWIVGAVIIGRDPGEHGDTIPPRWMAAGLVLSGGLLLTLSLGSHAAAGPSPTLAVAIDWIHMLAASIWAGGLVALAITIIGVSRKPSSAAVAQVGRIASLFSPVAMICVAVVAASGLYRSVVEVADWENLFDTPYGTALLIKVGLLLPVLGLAALSWLRVRRRLAGPSGGAGPSPGNGTWLRRLLWTVGGEVVLISAILLATGVVTSLPPAREAFGAGLVERGRAEDLRVILVASPGEVGSNTFDVYLRDGGGRPVADAQKVALIFSLPEREMGESEAVAENAGDGHYLAQGGYLSLAGTWRVEVLVRRQGRDDARVTLLVRPSLAGGQTS